MKCISSWLSGIPHKIYKECPEINKFLFEIFLFCINKTFQWRSAKETYIPKVNSPTKHSITDIRSIALLKVEGKIFFSSDSMHLEAHLINNIKFVNKSVQKCCMEKASGCWDHISMFWRALKKAESKILSLALIWLDTANACESIPHKPIIFALFWYGFSPKWIQLIETFETYYSGIIFLSADTLQLA